MNSLEQYISDLNPSCWLNSDHVNGYGVTQPTVDGSVTEWKDISGNNNHLQRFNFWRYGVETQANNRLSSSPQFKVDINNIPYLNFNGNEEALGVALSGIFSTDNNIIITIGTGTFGTWDGGNNRGIAHKTDFSKWMYGNPFSNLNPQTDTAQISAINPGTIKSSKIANYYDAYILGVDYTNNKTINGFMTDAYIRNNTSTLSFDNISTPNISINGWKLYNYRYDVFTKDSRAALIVGNIVKNFWSDVAANNQSWFYPGAKKYCEVICFDKFLTIEQLKQVQTYLKLKYNI